MNKDELVERLAKQIHQSKGKAADQVDTLVYRLLKDLKHTQEKPAKRSENSNPKGKK